MSDLAAPPSIDPAQQRAFEDWLDETHGFIQILDGMYLPSEVLSRVDPDAYNAELIAFSAGGFPARAANQPVAPAVPPTPPANEAIRQIVRDRFPLPIALSMYRFERGTLEPNLQLLYFRDIWESVVFLLYALVVGEFQAAHGSLVGTRISLDRLLSDSVNDKLTTMRQLRALTEQQHLGLTCTSMVSDAALDHLNRLNRVRNDFSHNSALSERQASELIVRHEATVMALLQEVAGLQDVLILRFRRSSGSVYHIQHQSFVGHNISRSFGELTLEAARIGEFAPYLNDSKVLAYTNGRLFSLAPFVHFVDDPTGQWTKLCFLKQRGTNERRGKLIFEVLGDAVPRDEDDLLFQTELNQLAALVPPAPARGTNTP